MTGLEQFLVQEDKRASLTEVKRLMLDELERLCAIADLDLDTFDYSTWSIPFEVLENRDAEKIRLYSPIVHICESLVIIDEKLGASHG